MNTQAVNQARERLADARRDLLRLIDRLHDGETVATGATLLQMTLVDRLARELRRLTQVAA